MKLKAYRYYMKYETKRWDWQLKQHVPYIEEYTSSVNNPTPDLAQKELDENLALYTDEGIEDRIKVIESRIEEVEIDDEITVQGIIDDNGLEYEDYAVVIRNPEDRSGICIESVIGDFQGFEVEITIKLKKSE